jgi:ribosomal protein S27AE
MEKKAKFCPYCGTEDIEECDVFDFQPIDDDGDMLTLVEHQCMKCGMSFWA